METARSKARKRVPRCSHKQPLSVLCTSRKVKSERAASFAARSRLYGRPQIVQALQSSPFHALRALAAVEFMSGWMGEVAPQTHYRRIKGEREREPESCELEDLNWGGLSCVPARVMEKDVGRVICKLSPSLGFFSCPFYQALYAAIVLADVPKIAWRLY